MSWIIDALIDACFNPTLVRLRPEQIVIVMIAMMFQSHAGSIEAACGGGAAAPWRTVSIPRWFD